ncbi:MAG: tetraacyldisaccharide 4'-kinase [Proteobacteria bacterium]|nr:tetraacyldisaccharide 4'-kinase [Pseudomonadota bacterium]
MNFWWRSGTVLAVLLAPLAALYGALAAWQRRRTRPQRLAVPVVVVGNIVVGGAGKTPTTIALVRALQAAGWRPAVVSRGYGRRTTDVRAVTADSTAAEVGDEPLLIHRATGVPVMVGAQRVAAGRALLAARPDVNVVVADDGLQHHALARDAQLIVFDARGVGNGRLLPAGPLREPLPAALPPRTWVIYNAPAPSTPLPGACAVRRLAGAVSLADWHRGTAARAEALADMAATSRHAPLWAAAGIAEPERFFAMLEAAGIAITRLPLPDHAPLNQPPWPIGATVLVTEKDAVKLPPSMPGVWVVPLDFSLPSATVTAVLAALHHEP